MMRSQRIGSRYLAGFVIAAAIVYLAGTCIASTMAWRVSYPPWLLTNFIALGLIPAGAAAALGARAWSRPEGSAGLCATGLVVLILALVIWQFFVVSF